MSKNNKNTNLNSIVPADVKPPAVPEIEAAVLGAMLIEKEAVPRPLSCLHPIVFI